MRNSSPHRTNRRLLNGTVLLLLLPFFAGALYLASSAGAGPFQVSVAGLMMVLAAVLVLWRGRADIAIVLLVVTTYGTLFWSEATSAEAPRRIDVIIGERSPIAGVDVYCNGVHLGRTPLRISREELRKKVEPWKTPPRQPALEPFGDPAGDRAFPSARYTWVPWAPHDPFADPEKRPSTERLIRAHRDAELFELLPEIGYWWRFERDGHAGLTRLANFGGSAGGSGKYVKMEVNPDVEYPALPPHVDLLVEALRRNDYAPTDRWIEHFVQHRESFFLEFHERTENEPRLRPALEAAVRAHFNLPQEPTPEDCDPAVEQIVELAEERGSFQIPSMSSMALDIMGEAAELAVTRLFGARIDIRPHRRGRSSSSEWEIRLYEPGGGLLPLEYAAKRLHPPELFAPLVYQYGRQDRYFDIVAGYRNEKAAQLVERRLRDPQFASHRRFEVLRTLQNLVEVRNPAVEQHIRQVFHELGHQHEHVVLEFIESRTGAPWVDQTELAGWIYHSAPIDERHKRRLLPRVPSPKTYHYLRMLGIPRDRSESADAMQQVATHPNPYLDEFIIDTWKWYDSPDGPRGWSRTVTKALLGNDTEQVREFLRARISQGGAEARQMLDRIARCKVNISGKDWLVDALGELKDPALQAAGARVLARVEANEARGLLRRWAESENRELREAATDALEAHRRREQQARERMQKYEALLDGRIDPDDLAPPTKAWVWNGERYVPEAKAEDPAGRD